MTHITYYRRDNLQDWIYVIRFEGISKNVRRMNVTYDLTILYLCVNRILICSSNKQSLSNKHTTIYVFHSIHLRPRGTSNVSCLLSFPVTIDLAHEPNLINFILSIIIFFIDTKISSSKSCIIETNNNFYVQQIFASTYKLRTSATNIRNCNKHSNFKMNEPEYPRFRNERREDPLANK